MGQKNKHLHPTTTLYDHIRELQMRLFVSAIALVIAGVVVYLFYGPILVLLSSPLHAPLYYNSPAGGFAFIMKICFTGALIITIPILAYNLIMFVRPAFGQLIPMKQVFITAGTSTILAIAGAVFAFYCILPGTLSFLKGFQVDGLSALISADNYLGFVTNIIITFVIVFQIPLVIAFIDRIKPLQPKKLLKMEKWVILGSLVVALLAPFTYDLVTSLLIALPIVVLYNLSIAMVVVRHAQLARKARKATHSTIVKPVIAPEFALNEQILENFTDELIYLEKPIITSPVITTAATMVMSPKRVHRVRPVTVQPPAWAIERKLRREALYEQVRAFSEVHQNASVKRVLASQ